MITITEKAFGECEAVGCRGPAKFVCVDTEGDSSGTRLCEVHVLQRLRQLGELQVWPTDDVRWEPAEGQGGYE